MSNAPSAPRLAIVLSHPTQYYSPWFRWMAARAEIQLRVFYLWDFGVTAKHDQQFGRALTWDVDLLDGYEHEFVPNVSREPGTHHYGGLRNPALTPTLNAWRPDAVLLFGYKYASHLGVIAWARRRGVPLIFRGDSHFLGRRRPNAIVRTALHLLYRQFKAITFVGAANRDYFRLLGVPAYRLFFAPHAVNHELFDPDYKAHVESAAALRAQLRLPPDMRVILFAGKLLPAKQPRELLNAFVSARPKAAALIFVGEGEEKPALELAAHAAPAGSVHFLPFANQSEMPARYLLADIFALPSRGVYETWGLAVNEAMHMGVPALVSDRVGCQRDLVTEGETGWVFAAGRNETLTEKLAEALAAVQADRAGWRTRVRERISRYTYSQATDGLQAAVRLATAPSRS